MPTPISIALPHSLGTKEVRRRLDKHTDWICRRLEQDRVALTIGDWDGDRRPFSASALGQTVRGTLGIADDTLRFEANLPWTLGIFSPAIEAAARHYGARLFD